MVTSNDMSTHNKLGVYPKDTRDAAAGSIRRRVLGYGAFVIVCLSLFLSLAFYSKLIPRAFFDRARVEDDALDSQQTKYTASEPGSTDNESGSVEWETVGLDDWQMAVFALSAALMLFVFPYVFLYVRYGARILRLILFNSNDVIKKVDVHETNKTEDACGSAPPVNCLVKDEHTKQPVNELLLQKEKEIPAPAYDPPSLQALLDRFTGSDCILRDLLDSLADMGIHAARFAVSNYMELFRDTTAGIRLKVDDVQNYGYLLLEGQELDGGKPLIYTFAAGREFLIQRRFTSGIEQNDYLSRVFELIVDKEHYDHNAFIVLCDTNMVILTRMIPATAILVGSGEWGVEKKGALYFTITSL